MLERLLAVLAERHGAIFAQIELPQERHRWTSALDRVPLKAALRSSEPENSDGSAHLARLRTSRLCSLVWTRSSPAAVIKAWSWRCDMGACDLSQSRLCLDRRADELPCQLR